MTDLLNRLETYQKQVVKNSQALAKALVEKGFKLVSGGSDNHLILIDLSSTDISGKVFEEALGKCEITVNKNTVPNEKRSPFVTSGIRIGTPSITTRGLKEAEMETIAGWMGEVLNNTDNENVLSNVKNQVKTLTSKFPLYPNWSKKE